MPRELHDHYFKMAKKEGYLARAAYKLIEINERRRVFRRGQNVLDFGSAPGSWLQVASKKVAPSGNVVGVDLSEVHHTFCDGNVTCLVDDVFTMKPDVAQVKPVDLMWFSLTWPRRQLVILQLIITDLFTYVMRC